MLHDLKNHIVYSWNFKRDNSRLVFVNFGRDAVPTDWGFSSFYSVPTGKSEIVH